MRSILFITGTRADYGKMKPLMHAVENSDQFELNIFVSGMHLIERLGNTYKEVLRDGYKNVYIDFAQTNRGIMSYDLGVVISNLSCYVRHIKPEMIVVHGDRCDALAGAVVGALNNIRVVHVEGGEISGTIDESIRHAISKLAHFHLVSNEAAKKRLCQMGEKASCIKIIGSPDIDIMLSKELPSMENVKKRYDITFDRYGIFMYHPVTTEYDTLPKKIEVVVSSIIKSERNYVVVYPNNDMGSELILNEYRRFDGNKKIRVFPSLRFEYFLTLMKNADFVIGNSSAGVRETGVYGIPAIDIGTRQKGRYNLKNTNIQHVEEKETEILNAITNHAKYRLRYSNFGSGNSTECFMGFLYDEKTWLTNVQKVFVDID